MSLTFPQPGERFLAQFKGSAMRRFADLLRDMFSLPKVAALMRRVGTKT